MASEIAKVLWRKARMGGIERGRTAILMAAVSEMPIQAQTWEIKNGRQ